ARRGAAGLQRRPGGRRPAQGQPAGDPQPAGPSPRAAASAHRLLERPRLRGGRQHAARRQPGLPAHAEQRRGLPGGEGPAAGAGPLPTLTVRDVLAILVTLYLVILGGRAVLSWFPVRGGTFLASLNTLLFELTEPVLRPVRKVIPPAGLFDTSFIIVFFVLIIAQSALRSS